VPGFLVRKEKEKGEKTRSRANNIYKACTLSNNLVLLKLCLA
jgi:hypothetical protein